MCITFKHKQVTNKKWWTDAWTHGISDTLHYIEILKDLIYKLQNSWMISVEAGIHFAMKKNVIFKLRQGASIIRYVGRSVRLSVGRSVGRSVRLSVGPSVRLSKKFTALKWPLWPNLRKWKLLRNMIELQIYWQAQSQPQSGAELALIPIFPTTN